ncbi:MAG: hypothetical protein J0G33_06650 [Afipia felis]|nr:hypothetical protein [Afipia felis]
MRLSRRRFVEGSALLILGNTADSVASELDHPSIERMKARRTHLMAECERLDRLWCEAQSKMPWHLLPGPKFRGEYGEGYGPRVGWPADLLGRIKLKTGFVLVRPSPRDLRELFEQDALEKGRETAAINYRQRIRQLRARLGLKRQWESDVGMPRTLDWEPLDIEIEAIDESLKPSTDG